MAEIRNKFVSWTQNIVKEIKTQGSVYGVGINLALVQPVVAPSSSPSLAPFHHRVGVDSVEPTGPAAKVGLQSGDVIVEVDGKRFDDGKAYLPDDVAAAVRGPEGSKVGVVVERDGTKVTFVITREPIGVVAVAAAVVTPPSSPGKGSLPKEEAPISQGENEGDTQEQEEQQQQGKEKLSRRSQNTSHRSNQQGSDTCDKQKTNKKESVPEESKQEVQDVLESLDSLALSEEEHKEKDLTSSAESADKFDETAPRRTSSRCSLTPLLQPQPIVDEISEEKTVDNNDEVSSIMNSVGDDSQWELISERSGSAIVVSFSGSVSGTSFRSASPSVLKNKFVLTESTGEAHIDHVVLPTDTLQGLCLAYKISATRLRMENGFSGNSLQMAPKRLRIPVVANGQVKGMMIRTQDTDSREYKLYAVVADLPTMELVEAKAYLDLSNWDLEEALRSAREDEGWNLKGGFEPPAAVVTAGICPTSPMQPVVARPKALTAKDIYAAPPPFDGDGFELKDIKHEG